MANGSIQRFKSGQHLLKELTNNPALPTFVPRMTPLGLGSLIREIGIADSAELVELTTPEQLAAVVDDTVWTNPEPGTPEHFDPEEFLQWVEVLLEIGDEFTAERLVALDPDLLTTAMHYFLKADDRDLAVVEPGQAGQVAASPAASAEEVDFYGRFEVAPRHSDEWTVIKAALEALHIWEPDELTALLARCSMAASLVDSNRGVVQSELDAAHTHQQRKESEGFVSPESARQFLDSARDTSLNELVNTTEYDLDTSLYLEKAKRGAEARRVGTPEDETEAQMREEPEADNEQIDSLHRAVATVELNQSTTGLLGYDNRARRPLDSALLNLGDSRPEALPERLMESAYLSNLLGAGSLLGGQRFNANDAAEAVMSICNLGFETRPDWRLDQPSGLVGLFRIGWHRIQKLQRASLEAVNQALTSEEVRHKLGIRLWILDDILKDVASHELRAKVELREFEEVQDTLSMLSLIFDAPTCDSLELLFDDLPCLGNRGGADRLRRRYIASLEDLADVEQLLINLPDRVKPGR